MNARAGIVLTVLIWGSQFPLVHDLAARWDIYSMNLIRYPAGALVLLLLARMIGPSPVWPTWVSWPRQAMLGAAVAAFAIFFTQALALGDPVTNAVVAALAPVTSSFVAWVVDRSRPSAAVLAGLVLVVPGAVLASVELSAGGGQMGGTNLVAVAFMLGAQLCWAWYSLMAQRWLEGLSQLAITGCTFACSVPYHLLAFVIASLAGITFADWMAQPLTDAIGFLVLVLGALVAGVALWNHSVAKLGLAVTALHINLIPVTAIAITYAFGITPRIEQLVGAALVIGGIVIAQTGWLPWSKAKPG